MVAPIGSPQPVFTLPPLADILDSEEDKPQPGLPLVSIVVLNVSCEVTDLSPRTNLGSGICHVSSSELDPFLINTTTLHISPPISP